MKWKLRLVIEVKGSRMFSKASAYPKSLSFVHHSSLVGSSSSTFNGLGLVLVFTSGDHSETWRRRKWNSSLCCFLPDAHLSSTGMFLWWTLISAAQFCVDLFQSPTHLSLCILILLLYFYFWGLQRFVLSLSLFLFSIVSSVSALPT